MLLEIAKQTQITLLSEHIGAINRKEQVEETVKHRSYYVDRHIVSDVTHP
jgi:hypothetical protein